MAASITAFLIWGLTPIYWKALQGVPAAHLLAHRIIWSSGCLALLISFKGYWPQFTAIFKSRAILGRSILSAAMIAMNWFIFIYAIVTNRILETSLGYFINPFVTILLARMFLSETLRPVQGLALVFAAAAVGFLAIQSPFRPWLALALATTFGIYGLMKKTSKVNPVVGLFFETITLTPLMLLYLVTSTKMAFLGQDNRTGLLLLGTGILTALPLVLFGWGVKRIPLVTTGLLQYLAPSVSFLIGVFLYGEPFTQERIVAFTGVWAALAIYTVEGIVTTRKRMKGHSS